MKAYTDIGPNVIPAEQLFVQQHGGSRSKGGGLHAGPMLNAFGLSKAQRGPQGKRDIKAALRRDKIQDSLNKEGFVATQQHKEKPRGKEPKGILKKTSFKEKPFNQEGFTMTGSRNCGPYPKGRPSNVNMSQKDGDYYVNTPQFITPVNGNDNIYINRDNKAFGDYHVSDFTQGDDSITSGGPIPPYPFKKKGYPYPKGSKDPGYAIEDAIIAERRKEMGDRYGDTTVENPNPRSQNFVFANKHGNIPIGKGISMTSGTSITADGLYISGNVVSGGNAGFTKDAVGPSYPSIGNQYIDYIPKWLNTNNSSNYNNSTFYDRADENNHVTGEWIGPDPELTADVACIGGSIVPGTKVPSMFKSSYKTMDNFFQNIEYIKDNPQVTEFYGSNIFELQQDGLYSGYKQPNVYASAKKNIANEFIDDRIVDIRFGNGTANMFALTNGPGSSASRGKYLNMVVIKAIKPAIDYIIYLKTKGKFLPSKETDDIYFVTEEQYFSVNPLPEKIHYACMQKYNTGMIDVFKFLNYMKQFWFKQNEMSWSDFQVYSGIIDKFIVKQKTMG